MHVTDCVTLQEDTSDGKVKFMAVKVKKPQCVCMCVCMCVYVMCSHCISVYVYG